MYFSNYLLAQNSTYVLVGVFVLLCIAFFSKCDLIREPETQHITSSANLSVVIDANQDKSFWSWLLTRLKCYFKRFVQLITIHRSTSIYLSINTNYFLISINNLFVLCWFFVVPQSKGTFYFVMSGVSFSRVIVPLNGLMSINFIEMLCYLYPAEHLWKTLVQ